MAIWYILSSFGIIFPSLVFCTKKNLATLIQMSVNDLRPVYTKYNFCVTLPYKKQDYIEKVS
jgi:hypothetical protein